MLPGRDPEGGSGCRHALTFEEERKAYFAALPFVVNTIFQSRPGECRLRIRMVCITRDPFIAPQSTGIDYPSLASGEFCDIVAFLI
jgi:hypothetical protein